MGRRFTLGKLTRMGRAPDNEIVLSDNLVSRYHATIEAAQGGFVVSDLGSKNGIDINETRHTEHRLRRGDRISIGETTLVFEAPQELKTARFTNTLIHLDPAKWGDMNGFRGGDGYLYWDPDGTRGGITAVWLDDALLKIRAEGANWEWVPAGAQDEVFVHVQIEDEWFCAEASADTGARAGVG